MPEPFPEPPLIPSSEALVQRVITQLQAQYPNWTPNPASPEYRMFLAFAAIACEVIVLCFQAPEELIRWIGEVVYQTPPTPATYATATATVEAVDTLGHTLEAGAVVLVTPEGGTPVAFEVTASVTIPPGESKTAAGAVKLQAVEPGTEGNIPGTAAVEPNELLAWVKPKGITLAAAPAGGEAEETIVAYTQRIRELARLVKPQPILPADFANYVRLLIPGIERCVAVDMLELKHTTPTAEEIAKEEGSEVEAEGVERCVTVIPLTAEGNVPPKATLELAYEKLKAAREETFKPYVGLPSLHPITIKLVGTFLPGYAKAAVAANLESALESLLSPPMFGVAATGDTTTWINKKNLFYQDVVTAIDNVQGFGHYTELKVNGGESTVALSGIAPLVRTHTLTGIAAYAAGTEYSEGQLVYEAGIVYESITSGLQKGHTPSSDAGVHWKSLGGMTITLSEGAE
ncbi:MAG TPA: baseplate J/gp47 family protein [Solirubrobacteraceae bacterium]|jgi:hypothetical protein|nr:baseplate J/gp47 family protein [Solirubrobacteraceae bacterium]